MSGKYPDPTFFLYIVCPYAYEMNLLYSKLFESTFLATLWCSHACSSFFFTVELLKKTHSFVDPI